MPLVTVAYVVTRYVLESRTAFILAQGFYLAPLATASILLARAAARSVPRSRSRRVWWLLCAATTFVFIGESSFSLHVVFSTDERLALGVFDLANLLATASLVVAIVVASALDRVGWRRVARTALDGIALLALGFALQYGLWTGGQLGAVLPDGEAARLSAYGLLAAVLLVGDAGSFARRDALRVSWNRLIGVSIALQAGGVAAWTVWGHAAAQPPPFVGALTGVTLLIAYQLVLMAALHRLADSGRAGPVPAPIRRASWWPGVLASTLVFASVAWLAVLAVEAPAGSRAEAVDLAALSVAAVCMVGRTVMAHAETEALTEQSLTDPLTGVAGPRALDPIAASMVRDVGRLRLELAVLVVDVDEFARLNAAIGFRGGERCLGALASTLVESSGAQARVFRLTGDEFVVLTPVSDSSAAERTGRAILQAVRATECEASFTVSIGVAVFPSDAVNVAGLVRCAQLACTWAKHHGKNRVVRYEPRIGDALSLDERMTLNDDRVRRDMARALLAAADARDPANHRHARNVAALARLLAEDLGFERARVDRIEMAAILHDVGKVALPDVLLGGRSLSYNERMVAREHSRLGERLIESLAVADVGRWVRGHHERWDGGGFPDGLAAGDIPMESRIIALADAYDGMTMGKRYGAPMSKAAALQEIDLGIGVRFDPDLAERFIRVVATTGALGWSDEWAQS